MIKAVIDIGTNTAHLLIGEVQDGQYIRQIHRHRVFTYLGEQGLDSIHDHACSRLYQALDSFHRAINDYGASSVMVLATDALRSASNGSKIESEIRDRYGWKIHIIDGKQEGKLIWQGVLQSLPQPYSNYIIMDIGGGSVEFIVAIEGQEVMIETLPMGISRLYNLYPRDDGNHKHMESYILSLATAVIQRSKRAHDGIVFIGSAGTFEVFLPPEVLNDPEKRWWLIDRTLISQRYRESRTLTEADRASMEWIPKARTKYIVVALALMETVIKAINPKKIIISKFALKEGAIVQDQIDL